MKSKQVKIKVLSVSQTRRSPLDMSWSLERTHGTRLALFYMEVQKELGEELAELRKRDYDHTWRTMAENNSSILIFVLVCFWFLSLTHTTGDKTTA